jgi:hypothetical protein
MDHALRAPDALDAEIKRHLRLALSWQYTGRRRTRGLAPWWNRLALQSHDGPFEKYDMIFNGAVPLRFPKAWPGTKQVDRLWIEMRA